MIKLLISGFLITLMSTIGVLTIGRADVNIEYDSERLLNGQLAGELEQQLKDATPLKDQLTEAWAKFFLTVFGQGKKGVLVGQDGWLFSREEYQWPTEALYNVQQNVVEIASINEQLAASGATLTLVLVPEKVSIYAEKTTDISPHISHDIHAKIMTQLAELGINVVSPTERLLAAKHSSQVYLKTDTHWTPQGAEIVADYAAQQLTDWHGDQTFATSEEAEIIHHGDLFNFLPINEEWLYQRIAPDTIRPSTTSLEESESFDLFAEPSPLAMALIGTSYSADARWNFHGYLQQAFSRDIIDFAEVGQGPLKPMLNYLQSETFQSNEITYVVWEFPIRYFVQDLTVENNK